MLQGDWNLRDTAPLSLVCPWTPGSLWGLPVGLGPNEGRDTPNSQLPPGWVQRSPKTLASIKLSSGKPSDHAPGCHSQLGTAITLYR